MYKVSLLGLTFSFVKALKQPIDIYRYDGKIRGRFIVIGCGRSDMSREYYITVLNHNFYFPVCEFEWELRFSDNKTYET